MIYDFGVNVSAGANECVVEVAGFKYIDLADIGGYTCVEVKVVIGYEVGMVRLFRRVIVPSCRVEVVGIKKREFAGRL